MKLLCAILALLVFTLSVQPACASVTTQTTSCCSNDDCTESDATNDEEVPCKSCNPFQVCSCCAFSVVIPCDVALQNNIIIIAPNVYRGARPVAIPDDLAAAPWQPPRVSVI